MAVGQAAWDQRAPSEVAPSGGVQADGGCRPQASAPIPVGLLAVLLDCPQARQLPSRAPDQDVKGELSVLMTFIRDHHKFKSRFVAFFSHLLV